MMSYKRPYEYRDERTFYELLQHSVHPYVGVDQRSDEHGMIIGGNVT